MKYQVGDLIDYKDNDPIFDTLDQAIEYANQQSYKFEESYIGIWEYNDDADLVVIVHQERIYTP